MVNTIHVQMLILFTVSRNIMTGMVSSKSYPGHGAVSGNLLLDFNEATSLVCTVAGKKKKSKFGRNGNKLWVSVDRAGTINTTSVKSRIESKTAIAQEIKAGNEEIKINKSKMKTKKVLTAKQNKTPHISIRHLYHFKLSPRKRSLLFE
jgi:hypothetical protein